MRFMYVVACASLVALTGCSDDVIVATPGYSLKDETTDVTARENLLGHALNTVLEDGAVTTALNQGSGSEASRNGIILARIAEIDHLYNTFENELNLKYRESKYNTSLVSLGVGVAGTFWGSEAGSQAWSAIGTTTESVSTSIDANFLAANTLPALISRMRASRAEIKTRILPKLGLKSKTYPLVSALGDLEQYWYAGTLTSALTELASSALDVEEAAEEDLQETEETVEKTIEVYGTTFTAAELDLSAQANQLKGEIKQKLEEMSADDKPKLIPLLNDSGGANAYLNDVMKEQAEALNHIPTEDGKAGAASDIILSALPKMNINQLTALKNAMRENGIEFDAE